MINWLKRFWPLLGLALLLLLNVESLVSKLNYKGDIREKDREIASLKQNIEKSDSRADAAIGRALIAEEEARIERAEKEKHKARAARIEEEKKELREKIASLPPMQIVVRTIEILYVEPKEITLQPQGVLFTLIAARRNLEFLEEFTLVKKQYGELQISLAKSEASEAKLLKACAEKDIAIIEKDGQLADWVLAEVKWNDKFNLCESQKKEARKKGRKEGAIIGGIIGGVIGFLLGK